MTSQFRILLAAALVAASLVVPAPAQQGGAGTGGLVRRAEEARLAGNWRRVLMIGAHPDDEDTELLTILSRQQGMETAYLSLTRGDGGQNLIGTELGPALGVLRTDELLAARRIDGARQFFGAAFDFGFSKTMAETFRFWPRDSLIKDAVRIIRRFRPQVVVAVWSGTPADGHGHHQAVGDMSLDAFHAAGDPRRFPELEREEGLAPWTPTKFYRTVRGNSTLVATLSFDGGAIDPLTGLSYHQLATRSRAQHRSQDQARLEDLGPSAARVAFVEGPAGRDDSLFAGVSPEAVPARNAHTDAVWMMDRALVLDATTDDGEVAQGQRVPVTLTLFNGGRDTLRATGRVLPRAGFAIAASDCAADPVAVAPGALVRCTVTVALATDAPLTTPYQLAAPRRGALFPWGGDVASRGEPFAAALLQAEFRIRGAGERDSIVVRRDVQARTLDQIQGEQRAPVNVVPRLAVSLTPERVLWPRTLRRRVFQVVVEHLARDTTDARVALRLPAGWSTTPARPLHFTKEGERLTVEFTVTAPLGVKSGEHPIAAVATSGVDSATTGLVRIRYPHVPPRDIVMPASATVVVADVAFPTLRAIGYVRGGGDRVAEALQSVGLPVRVLDDAALDHAAFDGLDVVVIGPRAYEASDALRRAHPRLLRWVEQGGTLLIQYEQAPYLRGNFPPIPFTIANPPNDRVTDELAPVTLLAPQHPLLRRPNRIGAADFDGWIQERGLDFARTWDARWTPLLESHDPGDDPRPGGLLVGRLGKGAVIYTGYAFFRQLPAAVPGAWRVFANLLGAK